MLSLATALTDPALFSATHSYNPSSPVLALRTKSDSSPGVTLKCKILKVIKRLFQYCNSLDIKYSFIDDFASSAVVLMI